MKVNKMASIIDIPFQVLVENGLHLELPNQMQADKWHIFTVVRSMER